MSDLQTFGPLIIATQVEDAAQVTLETWMPAYLRWVERLLGKPTDWLQSPQSYVATSDWDHFPEEALPAVLIMAPGTIGAPAQDGRRIYRAIFDLRVGVLVSAGTRSDTERLAKFYGAALRALILGKGSLGNFATGTKWLGESANIKVADDKQRTMATAENRFAVEVREVVKALTGPTNPPAKPAEPPPDEPVATNVEVILKPISLLGD